MSIGKHFPERIRKHSQRKKSKTDQDYRSRSKKKRIGRNVFIDTSPYKVKRNFFEKNVFSVKKRNKSGDIKFKTKSKFFKKLKNAGILIQKIENQKRN